MSESALSEAYMAAMSATEREAMVHRAGLNAEILSGGELRPGDQVEPL